MSTPEAQPETSTSVTHVPVMLREMAELLRPRSGGRYVDGTLGGGGHAEAILEASAPDGELLGIDWDEDARGRAEGRLERYGARVHVVAATFDEIGDCLERVGWEVADGIVVDLGVSTLQLDVAEATLSEREQIYALTRDRNAAGIDSRLELKQAESALPATREQIAQLQETIQLTRNQLAALLGQGPDRGLAINRPAATALAPVALPSALPAELLGRRPDIIAQRARVEAAQKDIASAKAEFYPNVNLIAFVGLQSLGGGGFLSAASRMMGFGPAVSLPIFDAGRLRANLAGRNAGVSAGGRAGNFR